MFRLSHGSVDVTLRILIALCLKHGRFVHVSELRYVLAFVDACPCGLAVGLANQAYDVAYYGFSNSADDAIQGQNEERSGLRYLSPTSPGAEREML